MAFKMAIYQNSKTDFNKKGTDYRIKAVGGRQSLKAVDFHVNR